MDKQTTESRVTRVIEATVRLMDEEKISPIAITVTGVHPEDGSIYTQAWTGDPSAFVKNGKEMTGTDFRKTISECLIAIANEITESDHAVVN